jgi:hypothetical protein
MSRQERGVVKSGIERKLQPFRNKIISSFKKTSICFDLPALQINHSVVSGRTINKQTSLKHVSRHRHEGLRGVILKQLFTVAQYLRHIVKFEFGTPVQNWFGKKNVKVLV